MPYRVAQYSTVRGEWEPIAETPLTGDEQKSTAIAMAVIASDNCATRIYDPEGFITAMYYKGHLIYQEMI